MQETKLPDGRLRFVLDEIDREVILYGREQERDDTSIFIDLLEWYLRNGWDLVRPDEIAALTSDNRVLLSEDTIRDEQNKFLWAAGIWTWDRYAITSEIDELLKTGEVILDWHPFYYYDIEPPKNTPEEIKAASNERMQRAMLNRELEDIMTELDYEHRALLAVGIPLKDVEALLTISTDAEYATREIRFRRVLGRYL